MQQENKTNNGTELLDILFFSFTWDHTTTCMGYMFYSFMPPRINVDPHIEYGILLTLYKKKSKKSAISNWILML